MRRDSWPLIPSDGVLFHRAHYPASFDPIVLNHARALLAGVTAPTAFIDADIRDTDRILEEAAGLLDF
ncbi:hypothetical protein D0T12_28965, partial [Actinomadura spongiicola]